MSCPHIVYLQLVVIKMLFEWLWLVVLPRFSAFKELVVRAHIVPGTPVSSQE